MVDIKTKGIVKASTSDVKMTPPASPPKKELSFAEEMEGKYWSWNVSYLPNGKLKVSSPNSPGRTWVVTAEEFNEVASTDVIRGI